MEFVNEHTAGEGAARGVEAVGWQAHDPQGHEVPNSTMNDLVASVRAGGKIGVVGVFVPEDPQSPDELMKEGKIAPSWGVSHHLSLDEGPGAYGHFDARDDGWTKVVLHPDGR